VSVTRLIKWPVRVVRVQAVNEGRKQMHKHHPAALLRMSEAAALRQLGLDQPGVTITRKKGKKGERAAAREGRRCSVTAGWPDETRG